LRVQLQKSYPSSLGNPIIDSIDDRIFEIRYFQDCMGCTFCSDRCCQWGVDVDEANVKRILAEDGLKAWVKWDSAEWFGEIQEDPEFPSGAFRRTGVKGGKCVFLNPAGRGCLIHSYSLAVGQDYHELKPMISSLFPLTFDQGNLRPAHDVLSGELVCLNYGDLQPSLYDGSRDELAWYFGDLVLELDALRDTRMAKGTLLRQD
jgi:hypothetical protein